MIALLHFVCLRRAALQVVALFALAQLTFAAEPPHPPGGPPPLPPSPIQQFREWLAMKPDQRVKAVEAWPAEKQKILLAKLSAYEALPAAERERRLLMLELRWHLLPLMGMNPEQRKSAMSLVPANLRLTVLERLKSWDELEPESRKEILANENARELATNYFLQLQQGRSPDVIENALSPQKREELRRALAIWNSLPLATRTRTAAQLTAFFRLSPEQQARTVERFPENDRQEMQKTLDLFAQLPPEQRRLCVESFEKFALMQPAERASFLRNAARWEAMTSQERTTWKQLVTKLPPVPSVPLREPPMPQAGIRPNSMVDGTSPR